MAGIRSKVQRLRTSADAKGEVSAFSVRQAGLSHVVLLTAKDSSPAAWRAASARLFKRAVLGEVRGAGGDKAQALRDLLLPGGEALPALVLLGEDGSPDVTEGGVNAKAMAAFLETHVAGVEAEEEAPRAPRAERVRKETPAPVHDAASVADAAAIADERAFALIMAAGEASEAPLAGAALRYRKDKFSIVQMEQGAFASAFGSDAAAVVLNKKRLRFTAGDAVDKLVSKVVGGDAKWTKLE